MVESIYCKAGLLTEKSQGLGLASCSATDKPIHAGAPEAPSCSLPSSETTANNGKELTLTTANVTP